MFVLLDIKQLQPCQDTRSWRKQIVAPKTQTAARRRRSSGVGYVSCGVDRNAALSLCSRGNRRRRRAVSVLDHRHSPRARRRGGRASQGAPSVTRTLQSSCFHHRRTQSRNWSEHAASLLPPQVAGCFLPFFVV